MTSELSIDWRGLTVLVGLSLAGTALVVPADAQTASPEAPAERQLYDPYPPGILPADLATEVERVRRETQVAFDRAMTEWEDLASARGDGGPQAVAGADYQAVSLLGELMNFDEAMSVDGNQACAFCHMPYTAYEGPIQSVNATSVGYPGSAHFRALDRKPMRYAYAPRFPVLQFNAAQQDFYGGNFWDGRATGFLLQNPNAEQATDPPVGANEMGFPDMACIAYRLSLAPYRDLFATVWGEGILDVDWPEETEAICATPAGAATFGGSVTPIPLSPGDRLRAEIAYDRWGQSLSFYESTAEVTAFSSKFDAYLAGDYTLTPDEQAGYELFRGKANCNSCHLDGLSTLLADGESDSGTPGDVAPLFTDFTYVNLGVPLNPRGPMYYETTPDAFGFTPNPVGFGLRDLGMGSFLRGVNGINPNVDWVQLAPDFDGAMQTMTARNVAMTPSQCPTTEAGRTDANGDPVPYFQKSFFHNGYIKSLKQLVHFYNTRDVHAHPVTSGNCPAGTTERVDCWPMPEVPNNVDDTIGDLGLTDDEEDQIVAFLEALTDGHTTPYPNRDLFTGECRTGGSAATQGNETLIATPDLPPCAAEFCGVAPVPNPPIP
ncbi:MAG: cytochrome c peroxidase [Pseudomonadota bacterium]